MAVALPYGAAVALRGTRRRPAPDPSSARPRAWRLPLPAPGFHLQSGDVLLTPAAARALGATGEGALERYALHWRRPSRWGLALKFGAFPLVPALVIFRANEVIGYGGFLGEYSLYGLARWATNLAVHEAVALVALVCWAALWRVLAEAVSLLGALAGETAARRARRGAEIAAALGYFAAVPVGLAAMFLR